MPEIVFDEVTVVVDTPTSDSPEATNVILGPVTTKLSEQRIGIIGSNGSGKSTLARLINGLNTPTYGKVLIDDREVASNLKTIRKEVGFVFSDAENQIVMPVVIDDVLFSLRRSGLTKTEQRKLAFEVLGRFDLAQHAEDSPHTLSGGQKQLLALASIMVTNPKIIVADEPTTLLDLINRRRIRHKFSRLDQQLIVATHDLEILEDFERVICLDGGKIVADGTPEDVIAFYLELMESRSDY